MLDTKLIARPQTLNLVNSLMEHLILVNSLRSFLDLANSFLEISDLEPFYVANPIFMLTALVLILMTNPTVIAHLQMKKL